MTGKDNPLLTSLIGPGHNNVNYKNLSRRQNCCTSKYSEFCKGHSGITHNDNSAAKQFFLCLMDDLHSFMNWEVF